jgi:pimeloyl-ACP methyl ester carboxylesterase
MNLVDVGSGMPIVIVPGVQGRWEWLSPAVEALARQCRVITFSLADEPTVGAVFDPAHGFDSYVRQVRAAMDQAGVERATICGVSYGGLIAAAFAAREPDRVTSLVLVSALPPGWRPDARVRFYLHAPRLLSPLFYLLSLRLYREIAAAHDGVLDGLQASLRHGLNVLRHMLSPGRMARRVRSLGDVDLAAEIAHLNVRTLVITGEDGLDRVVPPARTREYVRICGDVQAVTLPRTGHLGLITRADEFARVVCGFMHVTAASEGPTDRRRIG